MGDLRCWVIMRPAKCEHGVSRVRPRFVGPEPIIAPFCTDVLQALDDLIDVSVDRRCGHPKSKCGHSGQPSHLRPQVPPRHVRTCIAFNFIDAHPFERVVLDPIFSTITRAPLMDFVDDQHSWVGAFELGRVLCGVLGPRELGHHHHLTSVSSRIIESCTSKPYDPPRIVFEHRLQMLDPMVDQQRWNEDERPVESTG